MRVKEFYVKSLEGYQQQCKLAFTTEAKIGTISVIGKTSRLHFTGSKNIENG